jgi:hypothetical protein
VGADGLGPALPAAEVATVLGSYPLPPAAAAAAGSLARMLLAKRAAGQCLALRASLT